MLWRMYISEMSVLTLIFLQFLTISGFRSPQLVEIFESERIYLPPPPPITDAARYARYIVHYSDWASLSHISYQNSTHGYPMARVFSMSDGTSTWSSGIPYIYTSSLDDGTHDLILNDHRSSCTISLAEGSFCRIKDLDPEDPRCPQVVLTGEFKVVDNTTTEYQKAKEALFFRHPQMKVWPKSHQWFVGKINIESILLVNNIGGNKYPSVEDYFKSDPILTVEVSNKIY